MNIVKSLKQHFDEKGVIKGTREIVDTAAAVVLVAAVGYIAVKQIRTYMITKGAKNTTMDAPIDAARDAGSTMSMLRSMKKSHKQVMRQMEAIEHEAVDRLSTGRNRMFQALDYDERRSILEAEGIDVQAMEQQIQIEKKLRKERMQALADQQRAQKSIFNRIRNMFSSTRSVVGQYAIPSWKLRKTNSGVVYNSISNATWRSGKNKQPTAAVPNRFIVKPTGEIKPDTYVAKAARTQAVDKFIERSKRLPAIPNQFNKLKLLSPSIQKAYLDMRGQVARVCGAKLGPFEQQTHSKISIKDRAKALEEAWKSRRHLMTDPQTPWIGDSKTKDFGRGTNSDDNGEQFLSLMDQIAKEIESSGESVDSLTPKHDDSIPSLAYGMYLAQELKDMQDAAWNERDQMDRILQCGGVDPKDIPYFDSQFYDTDIDPFLSKPQRPTIRIRHDPLSVPQFNISEQMFDERAIPEEILENLSQGNIRPQRWSFGPTHTTDFSKAPYTELHRNISESMKNRKNVTAASMASRRKSAWRQRHPIAANRGINEPMTFLEEVELSMLREQGKAPRDKTHLNILMDDDLGELSVKKGKKPKKTEDYFAGFDFSGKEKKKKKKGKKGKNKKKKQGKKGKKNTEKPAPFMADYNDDDRPESMDVTSSILTGVGDAMRKRFTKSIKDLKAGKFYSR